MVNVKMRGLKVYSVGGKYYVYIRATGEALLKNFSGSKAEVLKLLATPEMMGAYNAKRSRTARSYPEQTLGWLAAWFIDPTQCEHLGALAAAHQAARAVHGGTRTVVQAERSAGLARCRPPGSPSRPPRHRRRCPR